MRKKVSSDRKSAIISNDSIAEFDDKYQINSITNDICVTEAVIEEEDERDPDDEFSTYGMDRIDYLFSSDDKSSSKVDESSILTSTSAVMNLSKSSQSVEEHEESSVVSDTSAVIPLADSVSEDDNRDDSKIGDSATMMNRSANTATGNKKNMWFPKMFSEETMSSLDSQEIYALNLTEGYANSREEQLIKKRLESCADNTYETSNFSFDSFGSMDSQEIYAMRMTFAQAHSTEEIQLRKAIEKQKRAKAEKLAAEYAEAEKERQKAKWAEQEEAKRKSILAAKAEEQAAEEEREAKKKAVHKAIELERAELEKREDTQSIDAVERAREEKWEATQKEARRRASMTVETEGKAETKLKSVEKAAVLKRGKKQKKEPKQKSPKGISKIMLRGKKKAESKRKKEAAAEKAEEERRDAKKKVIEQKAEEERREAEKLVAIKKAEAKKMEAARRAAAVEKAEKVKREDARKATEDINVPVGNNAAKEAVAAAQREMEMRIAEQKFIEAKTHEFEREREMSQAKKRREILVPVEKKASTRTIPDNGQYSDSDYSSDSNEDIGDEDDESGESKESLNMKDLKITMNRKISINSSVSGSDEDEGDDEDEDEGDDGRDINTPRNLGFTKCPIPETLGNSNKKKVVMFSKGLKKGKQKKILTTTYRKRTPVNTAKTTSKNMKTTAKRNSRKTKVKKRIAGKQMITIRQKGKYGVEDIASNKADSDAKVMRVCKLTSKGYVSAEFTSVDPQNTPLHIACLTHYPEKFILEHLMQSEKKSENYKAVYKPNSSGELPIHYAVMDKKGVSPVVLEALLKEFPESVEHKNVDGSLPIHVACEVGAPSLYSIKRLCQAMPSSVMIQNDLRVRLTDEEQEEERQMQNSQIAGPFSCFVDNFTFDWFGGNDIAEVENFETGWSPLHLASVNGAQPNVIETLIETDPECMTLQTNKGRTPLECAKWCVVNAIINDVSVYKIQNTFASIQIIQSFDRENKIKEELIHKVGLVTTALEKSELYGGLWAKTIGFMPDKREDEGPEILKVDAIGKDEVGLTDLHRMILSRAPPDEVQAILEKTPRCMNIMSTNNRTPVECAKQMLIKGILLGEYVGHLTNTFISLQIMQSMDQDRDGQDDMYAGQALSKSIAQHVKEKGELKFGSTADNYNYTKRIIEMKESGLGRFVKGDNDAAVQPHQYFPPDNLSHVNLKINIPVGFRRFRRAFLNSKEGFLGEDVLEQGLGYRE